jgi:hypothetical protein
VTRYPDERQECTSGIPSPGGWCRLRRSPGRRHRVSLRWRRGRLRNPRRGLQVGRHLDREPDGRHAAKVGGSGRLLLGRVRRPDGRGHRLDQRRRASGADQAVQSVRHAAGRLRPSGRRHLGGGALIVFGTNHRVTFGGSTSVTIAPGASVVSDPVSMTVPARTDLAVSLYTSGPTGPATYHSDAQQVSYAASVATPTAGRPLPSRSLRSNGTSSTRSTSGSAPRRAARSSRSGTPSRMATGPRPTPTTGGPTTSRDGFSPVRPGRFTPSSTRASAATGSWPTRSSSA